MEIFLLLLISTQKQNNQSQFNVTVVPQLSGEQLWRLDNDY